MSEEITKPLQLQTHTSPLVKHDPVAQDKEIIKKNNTQQFANDPTSSNQSHNINKKPVLYDRYLLFAAIALLGFGLLMVASASIEISDRSFGEPFHYLYRQLAYFLLGLILAWYTWQIEIQRWQELSVPLLLGTLVLLALVLIHGIGHEINGSMRWIGIGPFGLEVSELAKFSVILYLAGYLVRRHDEVRKRMRGFLKPLLLMSVVALLLLREPDFGAATVIIITALGMLFLAGVRLWQFIFLMVVAGCILAELAFSSPYRVLRLTSFLHPWANAYNSGYQLTQSLIAFGRGGWLGVGLGESVQKLFYLPEAQSDFLFAVLAEELGFIGAFSVIALFGLLVWRAFDIGRRAQVIRQLYSAYASYGFGLWIALQAMINIGVNTGLLPTKGLTLPLMSYGGSSMLVNCVMIAVLMRIDHEVRLATYSLPSSPQIKRTL